MFRVAPARLLIATAVACLVLALALRGAGADRDLFLSINEAAWRWVPPAVLSCTTILGHGLVVTMLLGPSLLLAPNRPDLLVAGVFAVPVAMVLSRLPKALIDSPRPAAVLDPALIHVNGMRLASHNSMPSGHAITAFLVVALLLSGAGATRVPGPVKAAAVLIAVGVALSRVAVGAHWPSDVLAGAALGLLAGVAGVQAERRWGVASRRATQPVLSIIVLACAATLPRLDLGYPLAYPLQLVLAALGAATGAIALWRSWAERNGAPQPPG